MSLEPTASPEKKPNKDLVSLTILLNLESALTFKKFVESRDYKKAKRYYSSLPLDTQEYIRYSNFSQDCYRKLFEKNGKTRNL